MSIKKITPALIVKTRKDLNMNQAEFWAEIGVTQSGGSRYESGRKMPPPTRKLFHLRFQLGLTEVQLKALASA